MSPRFTSLARTLAATFAAIVEHAKSHPDEADRLFEAIAAHLRSAAPMVLLGVPDAIDPIAEATIQLSERARIEIRRLDGKLNLYVHDELDHDADVGLTDAKAEEIRAALARVMAAAMEAA